MKKTILVISFTLSLLLCTINGTAVTIPVEVISNNSHVWGNYNAVNVTYDTGNAEIKKVEGYYDSHRNGSISFDASEGYIEASSQANIFDITVDTDSDGMPQHSIACAQTDTIFKLLNNINVLEFSYSVGGQLYYYFEGYLIDLTDNNKVIWNTAAAALNHQDYFENVDPFYSTIEYWGNGLPTQGIVTINYNFQSDHKYSVHLFAKSDANNDNSNASFGFNLKSVPEPATMLLLCFGLMIVAGLRRIFKKR